MRLLDLVEQQHRVRVLVDGVGEEPALVEADVARRRADEPRDRVALHILRHVEAGDLDPHGARELARDLGLAHTRWPGEEIAADRLLGLAEPRAGELDRGRQRVDRPVLAEHHGLEVALEVLEHFLVVARDALGRDARHGRHHRLDLLGRDGLAAPALGQQHLRGPHLVDHVDRLVRQLAVVDVAEGEFHRRADRVRGVAHLVMPLVVGLEPAQDLDRVLDRGLVDVDLLEAPHQRAVLLEVVPVFLVGGGPDAADVAAGERGLQ